MSIWWFHICQKQNEWNIFIDMESYDKPSFRIRFRDFKQPCHLLHEKKKNNGEYHECLFKTRSRTREPGVVVWKINVLYFDCSDKSVSTLLSSAVSLKLSGSFSCSSIHSVSFVQTPTVRLKVFQTLFLWLVSVLSLLGELRFSGVYCLQHSVLQNFNSLWLLSFS